MSLRLRRRMIAIYDTHLDGKGINRSINRSINRGLGSVEIETFTGHIDIILDLDLDLEISHTLGHNIMTRTKDRD